MTHETKQCQLWELDRYLTIKDLYNFAEVCDVYDAVHTLSKQKAEAKAKQNNKPQRS